MFGEITLLLREGANFNCRSLPDNSKKFFSIPVQIEKGTRN